MRNNNQLKHQVLDELLQLLEAVECKLAILHSLDVDVTCSGSGDLHDQLHTLYKEHNLFGECLQRAVSVVPDGKELNYDEV